MLVNLQELESKHDGLDTFRPLARGSAILIFFPPKLILFSSNSVTNSDGRCTDLLPPRSSERAKLEKTDPVAGKTYKIIFKTKEYFGRTHRKSFYPWVEVIPYSNKPTAFLCSNFLCQITFTIENPEEHYHIPLLISPYSFTTYRGS